MTQVWRLIRHTASLLEDAGIESSSAEARQLVAHALGCDLSRLALAADPSESQRDLLAGLVARRVGGEPLQYVLGSAPFFGCDVLVGPGVFIPRPETESLVARALEIATTLDDPVIVELCAGSGAISLALTRHLPRARIHAVELSGRALAWARRNLTGVDLRGGDMADAFHDLDGGVDLVVANPPYVPLGQVGEIPDEVTSHDPALALWGGPDGLDAVRVVRRVAGRLLRPGGCVLCEHSEAHADAVVRLFGGSGRFDRVVDHHDLAGRPRYVEARRALVAG